ncbi:class I SAM-dependent methyltransferase, partial [Nitrospinae bacterium AH_259_B05_G02_I21]|nr:class I SAM-dependent methyltransferase [Nitrospinae bacterium AH_259_B05_G02_I21]
MTEPSLSTTLRREIQRARLDVDRAQEAKLAAYLGELSRWNERVRLTGLESDLRRATVLVVQSLQMARAMPPSPELMVLDVGAGNGAPGLVLAVVHPYWRLDLLEANSQKISFLKLGPHRLHPPGTLGVNLCDILLDPCELRLVLGPHRLGFGLGGSSLLDRLVDGASPLGEEPR